MKPDKVVCQNCGKEIDKGKWCSDKCRKAYGRKSDNPDTEPGQKPDKTYPDTDKSQVGQPSRTNDDFRATLTKTDQTFYDRAMRDFGEPYYKFGQKPIEQKVCAMKSCGETFKTTLSLLLYCSYQHYTDAVGGKK